MNNGSTVMETEKEFVEISEDAYKQNSVYRPWTDNVAKKESATKHREHKGQPGHEQPARTASA